MTTALGRTLLRADAIFLMVAAAGGMTTDLLGVFFDRGPFVAVIGNSPHVGIGFVEAHGLAFIIGVLLWRAEPLYSWHVTAMAVHALLGTANIVFWQIFVISDMLAMGYITTMLHGLFAFLQLLAALSAARLSYTSG